jgi:flagellin-like protein
MTMKKGITPIIAIIILLLITMALAATAWMFLSGFLNTLTGQSFILPANSAGCSAAGTISVYMTNTGQNTVIPNTDIDMTLYDGSSCTTTSCGPVTMTYGTTPILAGELDLALTITNATTGSHTIIVGIAANTGQADVICP